MEEEPIWMVWTMMEAAEAEGVASERGRIETVGTSEVEEGTREERKVGTAEAEAGRTDPTTMEEVDVELVVKLEREELSFPRGR